MNSCLLRPRGLTYRKTLDSWRMMNTYEFDDYVNFFSLGYYGNLFEEYLNDFFETCCIDTSRHLLSPKEYYKLYGLIQYNFRDFLYLLGLEFEVV